MIAGVLRYVVGIGACLSQESIEVVLPVKELPQVDAGRVQAKTMTGIGVEENGPVVKLLPKHDVRVGYGFFTVFQGSILPPIGVCKGRPGTRTFRISVRSSRNQTMDSSLEAEHHYHFKSTTKLKVLVHSVTGSQRRNRSPRFLKIA